MPDVSIISGETTLVTLQIPGVPGATPNVTVGTVTTLAAGSTATVTKDPASTSSNTILNFAIPQGIKGDGASGGTSDHGLLIGLADDDHPQYLNQTRGDARYSLTSHSHTLTKASVGLGNVDNTSDAAKPVSTAQQTALNAKANTTHTHVIADITATGTPGATTYLRGDGSWAVPPGSGTGGVTSHAALTGLSADDHPQYLNNARGDARYLAIGNFDASFRRQPSALPSGTSTYTFTLTDERKMVYMTGLSNNATSTYTIPTNASVALPVGAWIDVMHNVPGTSGITNIVPATGVTLIGRDGVTGTQTLRSLHSSARLYKYATDSWVISGDIVTNVSQEINFSTSLQASNNLVRRDGSGGSAFGWLTVATQGTGPSDVARRDYVDGSVVNKVLEGENVSLVKNYDTGTVTINATATSGGITTITMADAPANSVFVAVKSGTTWTRPTTRTDVMIIFKGVEPGPNVVASGQTNGMYEFNAATGVLGDIYIPTL